MCVYTSCHIYHHSPIVLLPRQIVLLNQTVDPLLYDRHIRLEVVLDGGDGRVDELLERQLLLALHDPHDRRVERVLAVALDEGLRASGLLRLVNGHKASK